MLTCNKVHSWNSQCKLAYDVVDLDCDGVWTFEDLISFLLINSHWKVWQRGEAGSDTEFLSFREDEALAFALAEEILAAAKGARDKNTIVGLNSNHNNNSSINNTPTLRPRKPHDAAEGRDEGVAVRVAVLRDQSPIPFDDFVSFEEFTWIVNQFIIGSRAAAHELSDGTTTGQGSCGLSANVDRFIRLCFAMSDDEMIRSPRFVFEQTLSRLSSCVTRTVPPGRDDPRPSTTTVLRDCSQPAPFREHCTRGAIRWLLICWGAPASQDSKRRESSKGHDTDAPPTKKEGLTITLAEGLGRRFVRSWAKKDADAIKVFLRLHSESLLASTSAGAHRLMYDATSYVPLSPSSSRSNFPHRGRKVAAPEGTTSEFEAAYDTTAQHECLPPGHGEKGMHFSDVRSLGVSDFIQRVAIEPDPFSLSGGGGMNTGERQRMQRVFFWGTVRAALYGFIAALVIAGSDLLAQYFLLKDSQTLGESLSLGLWRSLFFLPSSVRESTLGSLMQQHVTGGIEGIANETASFEQKDAMRFNWVLESFEGNGWIYQVVVFAIALLVSFFEVLIVFLDGLRSSLEMAKSAGIPLFKFAEDSLDTAQGGQASGGGGGRKEKSRVLGGETEALRQHEYACHRRLRAPRQRSNACQIRSTFARARVGFVLSCLSRVAADVPFSQESILGVDASDKGVGIAMRVWLWSWPRIKRSAPTFLLRVVVGRFFPQYAVPFLATPFLAFWNYLVSRTTLNASRAVVVGVSRVERLTAQLLDTFCQCSPSVLQHNARVRERSLTASGLRAGGGIVVKGLHYCPYVAYRDVICLIAFYMRVVLDSHTVHPSLHVMLVYLATHLQQPEWTVACGSDIVSAFVPMSDDVDTEEKNLPNSHCSSREDGNVGLPTVDAVLTSHVRAFCASLDKACNTDSCVSSSTGRSKGTHCRSGPAFSHSLEKMLHLLEVSFPSWCTRTYRLMRLLLVTGALCAIVTPEENSAQTRREEAFLMALFNRYHVSKNTSCGEASRAQELAFAARTFVTDVQHMRHAFSGGRPVDLGHLVLCVVGSFK